MSSLSSDRPRFSVLPFVLGAVLGWGLTVEPAWLVSRAVTAVQAAVVPAGGAMAWLAVACLLLGTGVASWLKLRLARLLLAHVRSETGVQVYRLLLPILCTSACWGCVLGMWAYLLLALTGQAVWMTRAQWLLLPLLLLPAGSLLVGLVAGRRRSTLARLAVMVGLGATMAWFCGLAASAYTVALTRLS